MKNQSKNMFRWGNLVNVIYLAAAGLFFIIGLVLGILSVAIEDFEFALAGNMISYGIFQAIACILCFIFVGKAQKDLQNENNESKSPLIVSIVFGAISFNPFYVLAGIFGLVAENSQNEQEAPKEIEEKRNAPEIEPVEEAREEQ